MSEALQSVLAEVIEGLAKFFGTTTEKILAELPGFLARYGWYSTIRDLWMPCIVALMLGTGFYIGATIGESEHPSAWAVVGGILALIIGMSIMVGSCAVAPEIAGAHAIIEVLQTAGR